MSDETEPLPWEVPGEITIDPETWAAVFLSRFNLTAHFTTGEGEKEQVELDNQQHALMVRWFANAIEAGRHDPPEPPVEHGPDYPLRVARAHALEVAREALIGRPGAFQSQKGPDALDLVNVASWIVDGQDPWRDLDGIYRPDDEIEPTGEQS